MAFRKSCLLAALFCGMIFSLQSAAGANSWVLAENGESGSVVIVSDDATVIEKHAAEELAYFLSKVTGAEIRLVDSPAAGKYPIWLGTPETNPQVQRARLDRRVNSLTGQGFLIQADRNGLIIAGRDPLGVLYGVYGFLEDHAGMRWYYPGEEGEYCPEMPVLRVGRMNEVREPSFGRRTVHFSRVTGGQRTVDTWDWVTRNRMQLQFHPGQAQEYEKRGAYVYGGGHILSAMVPDELFDEHPEYFGLYGGERRRQEGHSGQPCTTHPDVIKMTAEYMLDFFERNPGGVFMLNNNIYPDFCECENCTALDPPEERDRPGGRLSTRFFTFRDEAAGQVWEVYPDARINTLAYQRFRMPPTAMVPDPRLRVTLRDTGRCFRHSLDDEDCNHFFREMFYGWGGFENPRGYFPSYNTIGGMPREEIVSLPMEHIVAADMRFMHRLGHVSWNIRVRPPDAEYVARFDVPATREDWRANYPWVYLQAKLAWDIDLDVEEVMEEMNGKLYGPAAGAMGRYRAMIRRLWEETPGHYMQGAAFDALGRTMAAPGAEREILSIFEEAEKAAGGMQPYSARVAEDRRIFENSWMQAHRRYVEMQVGDIAVAARTGAITIDGSLDEPDWMDCEPVTGFISHGSGGQPAEAQTLVRILYDDEYIYMGIKMEEPHVEQLVMNAAGRDDISIFRDDTIELFIDPDGERLRYVHIAINPAGVFRDSVVRAGMLTAGDVSFDTGAVVASRIGEGRWTVELKVSAESMGGVIREGGRWLMNVGRGRKPGGEGGSSWMKGTFHATEHFRGIAFAAPATENAVFDEETWCSGCGGEKTWSTDYGMFRCDDCGL